MRRSRQKCLDMHVSSGSKLSRLTDCALCDAIVNHKIQWIGVFFVGGMMLARRFTPNLAIYSWEKGISLEVCIDLGGIQALRRSKRGLIKLRPADYENLARIGARFQC